MRKFGITLAAVAAAAALAVPASAERGVWNNWHVHDGRTALGTDATGLHHAPLGFFPLIFGATYASTPALWAYCTDATDKGLVGGTGGAMFAAGTCRNEQYIIHLKGVEVGSPSPEGWTFVTNVAAGQYAVYYKLTPR